jgi:hypothetical protein
LTPGPSLAQKQREQQQAGPAFWQPRLALDGNGLGISTASSKGDGVKGWVKGAAQGTTVWLVPDRNGKRRASVRLPAPSRPRVVFGHSLHIIADADDRLLRFACHLQDGLLSPQDDGYNERFGSRGDGGTAALRRWIRSKGPRTPMARLVTVVVALILTFSLCVYPPR